MFLWGQKYLQGHAEPPQPAALKQKVLGLPREWLIYLCAVLGVLPPGADADAGGAGRRAGLVRVVHRHEVHTGTAPADDRADGTDLHGAGVLHDVRAVLRLVGDVHRPPADQGHRAIAGDHRRYAAAVVDHFTVACTAGLRGQRAPVRAAPRFGRTTCVLHRHRGTDAGAAGARLPGDSADRRFADLSWRPVPGTAGTGFRRIVDVDGPPRLGARQAGEVGMGPGDRCAVIRAAGAGGAAGRRHR
ncbi:hypothetical protein G6F35_013039 [Rhizopus arrhizus]|nr:hypothetical protein G6F35_013039 [Rhizopus arrhizus]